MALTRDFKETVKDRADRDPEFRNELLTEALEAIVCGDVEVAKVMLRDYINATEEGNMYCVNYVMVKVGS